MRRVLLASAALLCTMPAWADTRFEAVLAGHAMLPAATFIAPPPGAPAALGSAGRFAGPGNERVEARGSVAGDTGAMHGRRPTGLSFPFAGQPVQGFSGIRPVGDGTYWVTQDNGFGTKRNSADALLMLHRIRPDFRAGTVAIERTIFLSDPDRVAGFPIVNEHAEGRLLTGADFDLESIQPTADGGFWLGEEFGPFLLRVDAEGRLRQVVGTVLDGQPIRSPDHPALQVAATPTAGTAYRARRSGGYEGMAMTPDGTRIWAMLEQPLFAAGSDQAEGAFLRVMELDAANGQWTGRSVRFRLAEGATAIGDFNFVDERRALVIERDNGEGDPGLACAQGAQPTAAAPCFPLPARVKRVTLVDMGAVDAEGFVRKIGHVDLMAIRDPERLSRSRGDRPQGAPDDVATMPFFTIENVAMVDAEHIIVGNDNNLPFSAGRHLTRADDNELLLLRVPELLRAR